MALRAAGADAATSVFCDDSTRNVKAARAAGIFSVLVQATALACPDCVVICMRKCSPSAVAACP